ncbi:hypothetical protein K502DRAFT_201176 [Neoconidiobolus thromboides FSU 785]|nr:hypothetical protein K502DRAFT_201176 [Neoconidiobolus thromboides FSU 785]
MSEKSNKNLCQKEACQLQTCLQNKQYQEAKCQEYITALRECCKKILDEGKTSTCCPKKL